MNILFLLRYLDLGGLEVVTVTLAKKFQYEGHHVSVFAFGERSGNLKALLNPEFPIIMGKGYQSTIENIDILKNLLQENKVDVVINQWGLPLVPIKTLCKAKKGLNVKVISVYHNDPLQNGRVQRVATEIANTENIVKKTILQFKKMVYRCVTGFSMRYVYLHSDVFEVLSPSFVSHFQQFTWLKKTPKLVVQTNPITIDTSGFVYFPQKKRKEIIFVGRVDYTQKRVFRVIETWAHLESHFPNWQLTIVGDGEERENIEHMVRDLELKHVKFEGFQSPRSYYERASILMLTSEFEGFPLVLTECMSFGVVPVVYGSYPAVYDIIEDGKNGIIIPKADKGFNAAMMAKSCSELMEQETRLANMAKAAIERSKDYSVDKIYQQWMKVIYERII